MRDETRRLLDDLDRHLLARDRGPALDGLRSLFALLEAQDFELGYQAAVTLYRTGEGRSVLSDLIREDWWKNRAAIPEAIARSFPVFLDSITDGPRYGVNPRCFPEERPVIAYCDDVGSRVDDLRGLRVVGRAQFAAAPFMWLHDVRECVLLQVEPAPDGEHAFRSTSVGEFCVEVHHARVDGTFVPIERDDFCLK